MSDTVQEILQRIEQLPADDRLSTRGTPAELSEAEWMQEAAAARRIARERGLDQAAIDEAVHDAGYPS